MIALKTNHMMSSDILSFDSALLSPTEQSFFSDDYPQTQHCSEITSQASDEWLLDFEDIPIPFCDGLELGLIYEPELSLEAMTKEVDTQYQITEDERIDYLDSSTFLSPVSIEPSSPPQQAEQDTGFDSEAAISLLEEILVANSNGNSPSEQCYDELTIPFAEDTEVSTRSPSPEPEKRAKRQTKRKAQESEPIPKPKPTKRSKPSVEAKRERKRSQNKCAANRYRQKKRAELDVVENQLQDYEDANANLKAQLQKLQMEFKVVYPLAKAAFASDPNRSLQLQMLDIRVLNHEVLD